MGHRGLLLAIPRLPGLCSALAGHPEASSAFRQLLDFLETSGVPLASLGSAGSSVPFPKNCRAKVQNEPSTCEVAITAGWTRRCCSCEGSRIGQLPSVMSSPVQDLRGGLGELRTKTKKKCPRLTPTSGGHTFPKKGSHKVPLSERITTRMDKQWAPLWGKCDPQKWGTAGAAFFNDLLGTLWSQGRNSGEKRRPQDDCNLQIPAIVGRPCGGCSEASPAR